MAVRKRDVALWDLKIEVISSCEDGAVKARNGGNGIGHTDNMTTAGED